MDTKRFFLYFIVIVALTLAGCGGNGGGTKTAMPDPEPAQCPEGQVGTPPDCAPPGPTPEEMALKDAQDAAMAAYMAAMAAVANAKDYIAMQNAQRYADLAKEANDAAQAATASVEATGSQMQAEMYRDNAIKAARERGLGITKLANTISNQNDIDNASLEGRDEPKPVSNAVRVGAALASVAATAPEGTDETPAVTGDNPLDAVPNGSVNQHGARVGEFASARATRGSTGGPVLTVTLPGTRVTAVTGGEDPTSLMMRGDWMGAELVRTDASPAGKTYVNVYTDINPPTQAYTDPTPGANTEIDLSTLPTGAVAKLTADDGVPTDGSSFTGTFNRDSTDNHPPEPGQFNCPSGTACAISVDEEGVIKAIQGYEFHTMAGITKPDADYLAWGVWLQVPNAVPTGTPPNNPARAGAFASGNDPFQVRAELTGKATYDGVASGLYSAGGYVENFDADVSLMANFGANEAAGDDSTLLGAVTGSVTNIRAGGMDIDGMLNLTRAPITSDGDTADGPSTGGFLSKVSGTLAGRAMEGNWAGQFYGPNKAVANSRAARTEYPTTAAGTFGAAAENGASILGAFGSWKQ